MRAAPRWNAAAQKGREGRCAPAKGGKIGYTTFIAPRGSASPLSTSPQTSPTSAMPNCLRMYSSLGFSADRHEERRLEVFPQKTHLHTNKPQLRSDLSISTPSPEAAFKK